MRRLFLLLSITCIAPSIVVAHEINEKKILTGEEPNDANVYADNFYFEVLSSLLNDTGPQIAFFDSIRRARALRDDQLEKNTGSAKVIEEEYNNTGINNFTISQWEQFVALHHSINFKQKMKSRFCVLQTPFFEQLPQEMGLDSAILFSDFHLEKMRNISTTVGKLDELAQPAVSENQEQMGKKWESEILDHLSNFQSYYGDLMEQDPSIHNALQHHRHDLRVALAHTATVVIFDSVSFVLLIVGLTSGFSSLTIAGAIMSGVASGAFCLDCGWVCSVCTMCEYDRRQYYQSATLAIESLRPSPQNMVQYKD